MSCTEHTADVIIAGAGGAGMAAAIAALEEGASILLVEAAPSPGGTTAMSGGAFWIPNNSLMRAAGLDDPRPQALALMARLSFPALYDPTAPSWASTRPITPCWRPSTTKAPASSTPSCAWAPFAR
jgi:cation diffusion facilitator CzcD-associated flavoprotein CzcO